jgi:malate dehydrogenase (oxaloacetate-decarboxylating)
MRHEGSRRCIKRMRVKLGDVPGYLGRFATLVGDHGGRFGEITTVHMGKGTVVRDVTVIVSDEATFDRLCDATRNMEGVNILAVTDVVQERHLGGKIEIRPRFAVSSVDDLSIVYTPGVASICRQIQEEPDLAWEFTSIQNNVAIVTNGTAILGLGDIGPVAGMPVMEGKALLFQLLAGVNGFPILIDSKDPDEVVRTVKAIAPTFGAIKLEDIRAPECFEIEERLDRELEIPVMHDDQHGTAVVVLAALQNIAKYTYINLKRSSVGVIGLGAAGSGIHKLLRAFGVQEVYGTDINEAMLRRFADAGGRPTDLDGLMRASKLVIATTGVPGLIDPDLVQGGQVILALSNPDPEIEPDDALVAGAVYAADGKSVNNAMAFPGLFKGALRARATTVNDAMKLAAARTIAEHAHDGDLIPNVLDTSVHDAVAKEVEQAALKTGVVKYPARVA